jgi:hypothetical protein
MLIPPLPRTGVSDIKVEHVDAAGGAGGDRDQRAGVLIPEPPDVGRIGGGVLAAVRAARSFLQLAGDPHELERDDREPVLKRDRQRGAAGLGGRHVTPAPASAASAVRLPLSAVRRPLSEVAERTTLWALVLSWPGGFPAVSALLAPGRPRRFGGPSRARALRSVAVMATRLQPPKAVSHSGRNAKGFNGALTPVSHRQALEFPCGQHFSSGCAA